MYLGEVLFDHFPDGTRVLGGAPFNVAWHLQAFGRSPYFISRVGDDREGERVRQAMQEWGMETSGLQTDPQYPTGRVSVSFVDNEPHYDIVNPSAFDAIEAVAADEPRCGFLYHGSLALREQRTRRTAEQLWEAEPDTLFVDVNLRQPWWQKEQILTMVQRAHWIKRNAEELGLLHPLEGADPLVGATEFLKKHALAGLVFTRGAQGAWVITANGGQSEVLPQADVEIVDTVGAGDAFASIMILGLTGEWPLNTTLQRAQAFASAVVGQRGATVVDKNFYQGLSTIGSYYPKFLLSNIR